MSMSTPDSSLSVALRQSSPISLNVNLHCQSGELLALIGPSGSGKSTVLRTIAGLQSVADAQVSCGNNIWLDTRKGINVSTQARSVGLVFQHYALFPHMSALENVALAIPGHPNGDRKKNLTKPERRALALEWLARTNMTGLENRKPAQLSGGQRQRVALARALARQPQALLLDEPFSAVDQQTRRKLYRELAQLRSTLEIPMILVTHDINEVQQLADSLCLIHRGQSLQRGKVQEVINAPRSKTIAKLLGHQNIISATVTEHTSQHTHYQLSANEFLFGPIVDIAAGTNVNLLVAPSAISLCERNESANNSTQAALHCANSGNRLHGTLTDAVGLGDELSLRLHLDNVTKSLRFRLSLHDAASKNIRTGAPLYVHIRQSGIHAMTA